MTFKIIKEEEEEKCALWEKLRLNIYLSIFYFYENDYHFIL
jgi:hypothetical protein